MKTELKREAFDTSVELTKYVNQCGITKENIQAIVSTDVGLILFYWEITQ